MTPEKWVAGKVKESGITQKHIVETARVPGLTRQKLSATLTGRRCFRVEEFIGVCKAIKLDPLSWPMEGERRA
jgi:hypothetical protein